MVTKFVLDNGLTILVSSSSLIPKVAVQLWYRVGSKHETDGSRGMAHLLEHMTFKGTDAMSESDLAEITTKLSGSSNAFTSRDFTGYVFEFPTQHWEVALPLLAECMRDCTLKDDMLNGELKTVIQELKLYRDDHKAMLLDQMMDKIFAGHPYSYPIIGSKKELWQMTSEQLMQFYRTHYAPNNAVLIISGDVIPEDAIARASEYFAPLSRVEVPAYHRTVAKPSSSRTNIERAIQQPLAVCAFLVPGAHEKQDFALEVLCSLVASGKGSILYQKLVDELEIVLDVDASVYDLCEQSLWMVEFEPKRVEDIDRIIGLIHEELGKIRAGTFTDAQLIRALKQSESEFLSLMESAPKQAYMIGKYFMCTDDENYLFQVIERDLNQVRAEVVELGQYLDPSVGHIGTVLPFASGQEQTWQRELEQIDEEDERMLARRQRHSDLELPKVAQEVGPQQPRPFQFPRHTVALLPNGLRVLLFHNPSLPKIEVLLELPAQYYYDPMDKQGLSSFVSALLMEGTQRWTGPELATEVESLGMTLGTAAGYVAMSLLAADLGKALEILDEAVSRPTFDAKAVEKVREFMWASLRAHWDEPFEFVDDLAREQIYRGHPYGKARMGTQKSIAAITREDIVSFYRSHVTPQGSRLCIVGDLSGHNLEQVLAQLINWQGPQVEKIEFPPLAPVRAEEIAYPIVRDQVVLGFAGLSVSRMDPDYDKLLIFDQILTGSLLGSMSSRLFLLRERTGLFYTIGGSVIAHSDIQPGMVFIKTMVSRDAVAQAEQEIKQLIATVADTITVDEVLQARNAIINSMVDNFETNRQMTVTFLILDRFNMPPDYFDRRMLEFSRISLDEVKQAAKKILDLNKLVVFKVGQV